MEMTNTTINRSFQRFFDEDRDVVYNLFDAFIAKTFLEGKAIDFSKYAVDYYGQVEFATLEDENGQPILFSELLCGKKGDGDYKKCVEYIINAPAAVLRELLKNADWKAAHKGELVLVAHLHWLWSLGLSGVKTSCGKFGKYADIKEDWTGALNAYNLEDGLWYAHISAMGLKKELLLVYSILHRFMTWPNKPEFKSVDEIKSAMVDFVFKTRIDLNAPVRNGMLHLCDPDKYINIYDYEMKMEWIEHHSSLLRYYKSSEFSMLQEQDSVYYSKRIGRADENIVYRAERTEDKIRYIMDRLCGVDMG